MCRVTPGQAEKMIKESRKLKDLKILLNIKEVNGKDEEDSRNFLKVKRILTVVRSGQGPQKVWAMLQEANDTFSTFSPLDFFDDNDVKKT